MIISNSPFKQSLADDKVFVSSEPLAAPSAATVEPTDPTLPPSSTTTSSSASAPAANAAANPGQSAADLAARAQASIQNTKEYLQSKETKEGLAGNLAPDQSPLAPEQAPVSFFGCIDGMGCTVSTICKGLTNLSSCCHVGSVRPVPNTSPTSFQALVAQSPLPPQLLWKLYHPLQLRKYQMLQQRSMPVCLLSQLLMFRLPLLDWQTRLILLYQKELLLPCKDM